MHISFIQMQLMLDRLLENVSGSHSVSFEKS
jgi:hypothetical protein